MEAASEGPSGRETLDGTVGRDLTSSGPGLPEPVPTRSGRMTSGSPSVPCGLHPVGGSLSSPRPSGRVGCSSLSLASSLLAELLCSTRSGPWFQPISNPKPYKRRYQLSATVPPLLLNTPFALESHLARYESRFLIPSPSVRDAPTSRTGKIPIGNVCDLEAGD